MSHDLPTAESCDDAFLTEAVQALQVMRETGRKSVPRKSVPGSQFTTYFEMKSHKTLFPKSKGFLPIQTNMKGFPPKLTNEIKGKISHQN